MFKLLDSFDIEANFWEVNKQLKVMSPFSKLYKEDTSANKVNSSRIMWGIALVYDPDSKYHNFPETDRKGLVAKDWLQDSKFKWTNHENLIDKYLECYVSKIERSKRSLEKKLEDRERFLDSMIYTMDNAKDLDSIVANTGKIMEVLLYLDSKIGKEEATGKTHGDQVESAAEQQII